MHSGVLIVEKYVALLCVKGPVLCALGLFLVLKVIYDVVFLLVVYLKTKGTGVVGLVVMHRNDELRRLNVSWLYSGYLIYGYSWFFLLVLFVLDVVFFS